MAIAFVGNSAVATTAAGTTAGTVTYAATNGNIVALTLSLPNTVTNATAHDNNNSNLTLNGTQTALWQWYGTAGAGVTAYTMAWTTSRVWSAVVAEYSGAVGVGVTNASNSGSGVSATNSLTTGAPNDWIVTSFGGSGAATQTYAAVVGNLRTSLGVATHNVAIMDNTTAASGASVTTTASQASASSWQALSFELLSTVAAGAASNWLGKQVATGVNKHS